MSISDANGNITQVADDTGDLVAAYEYGPFGVIISASGSEVESNRFRFSTKYCDEESRLAYYGLRYYRPARGRWSSRDAIGERGGINLYAFVENRTIGRIDRLGLVYGIGNPVRCNRYGCDDDYQEYPSLPYLPGPVSPPVGPCLERVYREFRECVKGSRLKIVCGKVCGEFAFDSPEDCFSNSRRAAFWVCYVVCLGEEQVRCRLMRDAGFLACFYDIDFRRGIGLGVE